MGKAEYFPVEVIPCMTQHPAHTQVKNTVTGCFRTDGIIKQVNPVMSQDIVGNCLRCFISRCDQFKRYIVCRPEVECQGPQKRVETCQLPVPHKIR